jgi:drug/metabolite transporter (DMT)-like permease
MTAALIPEYRGLDGGLAIAAGLAAVMAWGVTPAITRHLVLNHDALSILTLRFWVTLAVMIPVMIAARPWRDPGNWLIGALLGVVGFLGYNWPNHLGAGLISSTQASLIIAVEPAAIAFLTALLGASVDWRVWCGILVSMIGAVLPFQSGALMELDGCLLVGLGALCWSIYSVLTKPMAARL